MVRHTISNEIDIKHLDLTETFSRFNDGVIITDQNGKILYYNNAQAKIDGISPSEVLNKTIHEVYQVTFRVSPTLQCIQTQKPVIGHSLQYKTRTGREVNAIQDAFPIFKNGTFVGVIDFVREYGRISSDIKKTKTKSSQQSQSGKSSITFKSIIGQNPQFIQSVQTAIKASASPSPVMLHGESGTGKELFAQSIHNFGQWHDKSFTAINCSAIPENLLEGILFGTSKGAFTGALDKAGLFEQANGGTIFLDEINSMPVGLQAKLLRVIQERKVRRIGSSYETEINLKVISSVNENPEDAIRENRLRRDLFYRLAVVLVDIPPLRERPDDLVILIPYFIERANQKLKKKVRAVTDEVNELFLNYHWPGNVRELEHIIEGSMNMISTESLISSHILPNHFIEHFSKDIPNASSLNSEFDNSASIVIQRSISNEGLSPLAIDYGKNTFKEAIEKIETHILTEMISQCNGNAAKAAKKLGMSRQLIYLKMKKLGITPQK